MRQWADQGASVAQWAFLAFMADEYRSQYPVVFHDDDMHLWVEERPVPYMGVGTVGIAAGIDGDDDEDMMVSDLMPKVSPPICIVQVNACTLEAKSKRKLNLQQFAKRRKYTLEVWKRQVAVKKFRKVATQDQLDSFAHEVSIYLGIYESN